VRIAVTSLVLSLMALPSPAHPQSSSEASKRCRAEAAAHKLSGAAEAIFIDDCLNRSQPLPALANEAKARHDQQQRKWDATAIRSMRSICAGCAGTAPRQPARTPRMEFDDAARADE
jgi:hypothetical protein